MREIGLKPLELNDLAINLLRNGHHIRFRARGQSMRPFVHNGDVLEVQPLCESLIKRGDIVLYASDDHPVVHRVVATREKDCQVYIITQGDASSFPDSETSLNQIYGRVIWVERNGRRMSTDSIVWIVVSRMWISLGRFRTGIFRLNRFVSRLMNKKNEQIE